MRQLIQFLIDDIKELEMNFNGYAPYNILLLDLDDAGYNNLNLIKNGIDELINKGIIEKIDNSYYRSCY